MSLLTIIGAGLLILMLGLGWRRFRRWLDAPTKHRNLSFSDFRRFFYNLRVYIGDEGEFFIHHEDSDIFIRFIKYRQNDQAYLHFSLPELEWSKDALLKIQDLCKLYDYTYGFQRVDGPLLERFLDVELDFSDEDAQNAVVNFSQDVFRCLGLSEQDRFFIQLNGVHSFEGTKEALHTLLEENSEDTTTRKMAAKSLEMLERRTRTSLK